MKRFLLFLTLLPLGALGGEKENLPSPERERLIRNCCVPPERHAEKHTLPEMRSRHWLRDLASKKRILITAIDERDPAYGNIYFGRPPKVPDAKTKMKWGIHWSRETGILESPF